MIITLNRASVYEYKGIVLVAGDNEVTPDQAAVLLPEKGIGIKADVEAGVLTVHKAKPGPKPKTADDSKAED